MRFCTVTRDKGGRPLRARNAGCYQSHRRLLQTSAPHDLGAFDAARRLHPHGGPAWQGLDARRCTCCGRACPFARAAGFVCWCIFYALHGRPSRSTMSTERLAAWVRDHGGLISGVEVRDAPGGGRGLFATRALAPDEQILRLPRALLLTGDVALAAPHVAAVVRDAHAAGLPDTVGELAASDPEVTAVVLFLMAERVRRRRAGGAGRTGAGGAGGGTDWQVWMETLPEKLLTPNTVDAAVLETRLGGNLIFPFALRVRDELRTLYELFIVPFAIGMHPDAYPPEDTTFEVFLWAYGVAETRAFDLKRGVRAERMEGGGEGGGDTSDEEPLTVLTPFADMVNHTCHSGLVTVYSDPWYPEGEERTLDGKGFQLIVKKPVSAGEQLFISYGKHDSTFLLLHYGFVIPGNPLDSVGVSLDEPDEGGEADMKKLMLIGLAGGGSLGMDHELTGADPLPDALIASMRLLLMVPAEADGATIRTNFFGELSPRNESSVLMHLEQILTPLLTPPDRPAKPPSAAEPGTSLAAFERSCDSYVAGQSAIVARALELVAARKAAGAGRTPQC